MKNLSVIAIPVAMILSVFALSSANAQQNFEQAYGNGVHHFFNGQYQKAYDSLSVALAEDSRDPRAYYFRGLAAQNLGIGSTGDFQMGAQMEVARGGRLSIVNEALERVQGAVRLRLENTRSEAIVAAKNMKSPQPVRTVNSTFPVGSTTTDTVVIPSAPAPPIVVDVPSVAPGQEIVPEPPMETKVPAPMEMEDAKAEAPSPFGEAGDVADGPKKVVSDEAPEGFYDSDAPADVAPADSSPFGDAMPKTPDKASPFGDSAAPAEPSPFGDAKEVDASPSPFGEEAMPKTPDEPSPFGDSAAPAESSPFGESAAPAEPSPFGGETGDATPEEPSPFGENPDQPSESPFGGETMPEKEVSPFGEESPFGEATDSVKDATDAVKEGAEALKEAAGESPFGEGSSSDSPFKEPVAESTPTSGSGAPNDPFGN